MAEDKYERPPTKEDQARYQKELYGDKVVPLKPDLFPPATVTKVVYDFDNIPDDKWFGTTDGGRTKVNANNVALLIKRRGFVVQYDNWYDSVQVSHPGYKVAGLVEDRNINSRLNEICCAYFEVTLRPIDFRQAIAVLAGRNEINSRLVYLDSFSPHYDKDYDWVSTAMQILDCDRGEYEKEIVRSLFAGVVQRSYLPGCALQRVISLIGGQGIHKSDFTKMLAGNPTPEGRNWWISKNISNMKDLDKASAARGVAVIEYAEMEGLAKMEVAKYKADTTREDDTHRQMYAVNQVVKPRQYDMIPTTNKLHYNFEDENRRDYGLETGRNHSIDLDLFKDHFKQIFAGVVHSVKNGMCGTIAPSLWEEARRHQRGRIVQDDLMDLVAPIIMVAHYSVATELTIDTINTADTNKMKGTIKNELNFERDPQEI
jgi:predicted P-loop ATPase